MKIEIKTNQSDNTDIYEHISTIEDDPIGGYYSIIFPDHRKINYKKGLIEYIKILTN